MGLLLAKSTGIVRQNLDGSFRNRTLKPIDWDIGLYTIPTNQQDQQREKCISAINKQPK
jgi:hypothetical protein